MRQQRWSPRLIPEDCDRRDRMDFPGSKVFDVAVPNRCPTMICIKKDRTGQANVDGILWLRKARRESLAAEFLIALFERLANCPKVIGIGAVRIDPRDFSVHVPTIITIWTVP